MSEPITLQAGEAFDSDRDHVLLSELPDGKWWGMGAFVSSASTATFVMPVTCASYAEALTWAKDAVAKCPGGLIYVRRRAE